MISLNLECQNFRFFFSKSLLLQSFKSLNLISKCNTAFSHVSPNGYSDGLEYIAIATVFNLTLNNLNLNSSLWFYIYKITVCIPTTVYINFDLMIKLINIIKTTFFYTYWLLKSKLTWTNLRGLNTLKPPLSCMYNHYFLIHNFKLLKFSFMNFDLLLCIIIFLKGNNFLFEQKKK